MSDFAGAFDAFLEGQSGDAGDRFLLPDQSTNVTSGLVLPVGTYSPSELPFEIGGTYEASAVVFPSVDYEGAVEPSPGFYWFERVHSNPLRLDLGNILSVLIRTIEIYNAYRRTARILEDAINNADVGVSFVGLPGLPYPIAQQHSLIVTVQISTSGPPEIDGTLDFDLDSEDLSVPITGTRIVLFPYIPEADIRETLEFATDIQTSTDGTEQRASIRKHPRQRLRFAIKVEEGEERRKLSNLLFGFHSGTFGVPVWFEARYLGANVTAGASSITVSTAYGDFRDGGLAMVWVDSETFDVLEIDSFNATSITFTSPLLNSYVASQALVLPVRTAITEMETDRTRAVLSLEEWDLEFLILDNEADIGSTAAFPSHDGKVLLQEENLLSGTSLSDGYLQRRHRLDNLSGSPIQFSDWLVPNVSTRKGFLAQSLQRVWEVRQLVHALRGSQVSFYLPTFAIDLVLVGPLTQSSFLLDVEHTGHVDFVNARDPLGAIWIELVDGSILTRNLVSATEQSPTVERLTVDVAWLETIPAANVRRISYLRLCRIADDRVEFEHQQVGTSMVFVGVVGVQQ